MNQKIFNYLKKYNREVFHVNRLLVSTYVYLNNLKVNNNKKILKLIICKHNKDEYKFLKEFMFLVGEVTRDFTYEDLLELFEFVISPSDKLVNGAVYTPKDIREFITNEAFKQHNNIADMHNFKIADISCGCGGFLINASKYINKITGKTYKEIYRENIFGLDIQSYSIERTEILLSLFAIEYGGEDEEFEFNLYCADSLEFDWYKENSQIKLSNGFDIILGNPPYVCSRNMDKKSKDLISKWSTCKIGHPDLYIPFFQIGFELLRPKGILGYITVNSFTKSLNGRGIRSYFHEKQVDLKIIDFEDEQIFNSRTTYTAICFLSKSQSSVVRYLPLKKFQLKYDFKYHEYLYSELSVQNGWYFKNKTLVEKIETIGTPLGDIYNTKSGIATLKNDIYIFKPVKETLKYYYIDTNTKIEKEICKDIVNSNLLTKSDQIDSFIEKIIFPYGYDENNQFFIIPEEKLSKKYPNAYEYLLKNKHELFLRDKGHGKNYSYWYAFGRNQSLEKSKYKLLFPQLARKDFKSYISDDENLYFYNGMAALSNNLEDLQILNKIFMSDIFWKYVSSISKNYSSNYFSLGKNYIKKFGIYNFTEEEKKYIISENDFLRINIFFNKFYS